MITRHVSYKMIVMLVTLLASLYTIQNVMLRRSSIDTTDIELWDGVVATDIVSTQTQTQTQQQRHFAFLSFPQPTLQQQRKVTVPVPANDEKVVTSVSPALSPHDDHRASTISQFDPWTDHAHSNFTITIKDMAEMFMLTQADQQLGYDDDVRRQQYQRQQEMAETPWYPGQHQIPLCNRTQLVAGQWIPVALPQPLYVTPTVHLRCSDAPTYKQSPYHTYQWQPDAVATHQCSFLAKTFRRPAFCAIMRGGTVLIAGDSLSWEQYSSLVQLNGIHTHQNYQHQSRELHMNIQQSVCDGQTAIVYRRDDTLQNLTDAIHQHFPTVLILNRGAHYVNDTLLLADVRRNIEQVRTWKRQCDDWQLPCHVFWRTSVPGHPGCGNFTHPVNDRNEMEQLIENRTMYNDHTLAYHWYDYQHQNQLVLQEWSKSGLDVEFIDAYEVNVLRPDDHRSHQGDCLHNCYPGKMDVYNMLLLHILRQRQTIANVRRTVAVAQQQQWQLDVTTQYMPDATEQAKTERESNKQQHRQGYRHHQQQQQGSNQLKQ